MEEKEPEKESNGSGLSWENCHELYKKHPIAIQLEVGLLLACQKVSILSTEDIGAADTSSATLKPTTNQAMYDTFPVFNAQHPHLASETN